MLRLLLRILMWMPIVAALWYFSRYERAGTPGPDMRDAMQDAARHYHTYRTERPPTPPSTPQPSGGGK
jgi:hypothetical protein